MKLAILAAITIIACGIGGRPAFSITSEEIDQQIRKRLEFNDYLERVAREKIEQERRIRALLLQRLEEQEAERRAKPHR